jgi:hypothetical protein
MKTHKGLKVARHLVNLLENRFKIGSFRFGLDPLLGLIPGGGDLVSFGLGLYLIKVAKDLGMPSGKIGRMVGNLVLDLLVGSVSIAGDALDFVYKANRANLKIIEEYLGEEIEEGEIVG